MSTVADELRDLRSRLERLEAQAKPPQSDLLRLEAGLMATVGEGYTVREVITLPAIGVTIQVVELGDGSVRLGITAPPEVVIHRAETPPSAPHPDERGGTLAQAVGADAPPPPPYEDVPTFDMDDFRKDAGRFTPTPEMRDEDWSALGPRKGG